MADPEDQNTGELKVPEQQGWGENIEQYLSPEGLAQMDLAMQAYSRFTADELKDDPAKKIEAAQTSHEYVETALADLIENTKKNFISRSGLLKGDMLETVGNLDGELLEKSPNAFKTPIEVPEHYVFSEISGRFRTYLIALIVLNEKKHRNIARQQRAEIEKTLDIRKRLIEAQEIKRAAEKNPDSVDDKTWLKICAEFNRLSGEFDGRPGVTVNKKPGGGAYVEFKIPRVDNEKLFELIDNPDAAIARMGNGASESFKYYLKTIGMQYHVIKEMLIPLLNQESQKFRHYPSRTGNLERDNDDAYALLKEEMVREVPMCTAINSTLMQGERLVMQFTPVEFNQARIYEHAAVQVNYHGGQSAKSIQSDRAKQANFKAKTLAGSDHGESIAISEGRFPGFFMKRADGNLRTLGIDTETIKLLAKNPQAYELIRRDILFYLAQLTCRPETLRKIFGDAFVQGIFAQGTSPGKRPPLAKGGKEKTDPKKRLYPYGDLNDPKKRALAVFTALKEGGTIQYVTPHGIDIEAETPMSPAEVQRAIDLALEEIQRGERVNHKRLLPLIKEVESGSNGERVVNVLTACEPSDKAKEKARERGQILKRGVEFPELEQTFYAEELPDLLQQFGITPTPEDPDGLDQLVAMHQGKAYIRYETWVDPERAREERIEGTTGKDGPEETSDRVKRAVIATLRKPRVATAQPQPSTQTGERKGVLSTGTDPEKS